MAVANRQIPPAPPPEPEELESREDRDQTEAEKRSSPGGAVVYKAVFKEGEDELARSTSALVWSGLAAGLSMGFSLVGEGLLRAHLPDAPWRPAVSKLGYSLGFLIVVLGRQQLFTENTLTVILPLLRRRTGRMLRNVLRLWTAVIAANLAGAIVFAWVAANTQAFDPAVRAAFAAVGHEAMSHAFATVLLRGIYAGWLIALMVWLLPFAETGRVAVIVILTYLVGLGGFSHIIAGSVECLYLVSAGEKTVWAFVAGYFIPTLIGNVIGGVSIVAALAHAQYVASAPPSESSRIVEP
jgi:formate/nitrite transporter FocA (FNT family)